MSTPDVVVIGGGILGLATARELAVVHGLRVLVVEAERELAAHQTGHNSGVVHSGLYYRPGSLKARLSVAGRRALERYVAERGIGYERSGKVVVAVEEGELARLTELERRGRENGLRGLERIDAVALAGHEPAVRGVAALWVPETGIIDYRAVAAAFAADVVRSGGEVRRHAAARRARTRSRDVEVELADGSRLAAPVLVACAGLESDRFARRSGRDPAVRIVPFRGDYYELSQRGRRLVRGLIYPVPDPDLPFLGVHFTRRLDGTVEAGPNAVLAWSRRAYRRLAFSAADAATTLGFPGFWRMAPRHARVAWGEYRRAFSRRLFLRSLRRLVPALDDADLSPGGCGLRAQAVDRGGRLLDDFVFAEDERTLHVLNAPSPAATASLALGEEIAGRVLARFGHGRHEVPAHRPEVEEVLQ